MNLIFLIGLVITFAYNADAATYCWNIGTGASTTDISGTTPAGTHCTYQHTYGLYGSFTRLMWPSSAYTAASTSNCPASSTCIAGVAGTPSVSAALVTNLPAVSSCYSGTYSASTLSSQTTATCTNSVYCTSTFSGVSGTTATSVTSACAASCTGANTLCTLVANTNQVLGCYVGTYYQSTSSTTMAATICAPQSATTSMAYCVSTYSWSSSNGYTITGSCAATCTAETLLLTGTVATRGTVCSGSIYGNPSTYSSESVRVHYSLFVMLLPILGILF